MLDLSSLFCWSTTLKAVACTFHGVAIACTVFRLFYRWYMARFWWEDGWAMFAFVIDIPCLVSAALQAPTTAQGTMPPIDTTTEWIAALGLTTVLWTCRISILLSIVRVTNPSYRLRRATYFVGCSFGAMWAALMVQKIRVCLGTVACTMATSVGLFQLLTNSVADIILLALSISFLRQTRMSQRQRIMLYSVFSASLLITVVAIFHSVILFTVQSDGTIVAAHVKAAVALIVCNLLVIVTFVYRICRRDGAGDLDMMEMVSFTNVDLSTCFTESTCADRQTTTAEGVSNLETWSTSTTQV